MSAAPKLAAVPISQPRLEPGDILTPGELAQRLKVPLSWIYKKSAANGMPVLRCGRYLRFSWPDVCAWMRKDNKDTNENGHIPRLSN